VYNKHFIHTRNSLTQMPLQTECKHFQIAVGFTVLLRGFKTPWQSTITIAYYSHSEKNQNKTPIPIFIYFLMFKDFGIGQ